MDSLLVKKWTLIWIRFFISEEIDSYFFTLRVEPNVSNAAKYVNVFIGMIGSSKLELNYDRDSYAVLPQMKIEFCSWIPKFC